MKKETHETSGNNRIANPNIPSSPLLLEPIERRKIGAQVELLCGVEASGRRSVKGHNVKGPALVVNKEEEKF